MRSSTLCMAVFLLGGVSGILATKIGTWSIPITMGAYMLAQCMMEFFNEPV